jgi:2-keto-4-pentenoate hydratase/2-oxohepta-3-ene-1,7-dioic acid hydratase in catechol pathway
MRWVTYVSATGGAERPGLVTDGAVYGLRGNDRLLDLLGDDGGRLAAAAERAIADPAEVVPQEQARLRAPIPVPPSIRDYMAFEGHIANICRSRGIEVHPGWYDLPVFYFTNPAAVHGPGDDVAISPGSQRFDYELEVAAVIGRAGGDLEAERAEQHIAGYLTMSDWSARDIQFVEMEQRLGPAKGKDSATSFGPMLVTPDELAPYRKGNAFDLPMTATVNGRPYSAGNLCDLYWSFGQMIAYASRGTRVVPGDIIGSGTVGTGCILELSGLHGEESYPWLRPGDEVRLDVAQLGAITARIRPAGPVVPLR